MTAVFKNGTINGVGKLVEDCKRDVDLGGSLFQENRASSNTGSLLSGPSSTSSQKSVPIAVCGMAMRLPGNINSADQFWDFIINKRDACAPIPHERYTTHGTHCTAPQVNGTETFLRKGSCEDKPTWRTHSYMLNDVDLAAFDASCFSMTQSELARVDPQQRLLLELTRHVLDSRVIDIRD